MVRNLNFLKKFQQISMLKWKRGDGNDVLILCKVIAICNCYHFNHYNAHFANIFVQSEIDGYFPYSKLPREKIISSFIYFTCTKNNFIGEKESNMTKINLASSYFIVNE